MKICFYEYRHYNAACGDNNFVEAWYDLLKNYNEIDYVQYSPKFVKSSCYQHNVVNIKDVDMSKYDIIIINNLYYSRQDCKKEGKLQEFIDSVYNLPSKTLYINHERYCIHPFLHGPNTYALASVCDCILTYLPHLYKYILKKDKAFKINFEHFYKPIEGNINSEELDRNIDLLYLARFSRQKGTYRYPKFAKLFFDKMKSLNKTANIEMYGFVPSISNVELRNDPYIINCLGKSCTKNSAESFIKLYNEIHDRDIVVNTFKQSKYSWNCFDVHRKYNDPTKILEFGLEACPLESILYGCVPILRNAQKNIKIKISEDYSMKLEDFNCSIFMDFDKESLDNAIDRMMSDEEWDKLHKNCKTFSKILVDRKYFLYHITKLLNAVYRSRSDRTYTTVNSINEVCKLKELVLNVKETADE